MVTAMFCNDMQMAQAVGTMRLWKESKEIKSSCFSGIITGDSQGGSPELETIIQPMACIAQCQVMHILVMYDIYHASGSNSMVTDVSSCVIICGDDGCNARLVVVLRRMPMTIHIMKLFIASILALYLCNTDMSACCNMLWFITQQST